MTGLMQASAADFADLITRSAPSGDAWPTDADAVQQQCYQALAHTFARLNDRANDLVADAFPATTEELLPEWEMSLGLPDPCAGPDATVAERRAHVVAKLTFRGGLSVPFYIGFAKTLGYTITITEFAPAGAGLSHAGDPCYGPAWAFAWQVNALPLTSFPAQAGQAHAGDPLVVYGNSVLPCELKRLSRASRTLLFNFANFPAPATWGTGRWNTDYWAEAA